MDGGSYIGAYRACTGIKDAFIISHAPVGCHYSAGLFNTISDQICCSRACSVIQEREVIFGGEEKLGKVLWDVEEASNSPLIVVLSSDVPTTIGDDVESVIKGHGNGRTVIAVSVPSFKGGMEDGYEEALLCFSDLMKERDVAKNSVNIIGMCPDDHKAAADLKEIRNDLAAAGIKVNCAISMCTAEELASAPAAELNVLVGPGHRLAGRMKKEFGIPYVDIEYPYGVEGTEKFIEEVSSFFSVDAPARKNVDITAFKKIYLYLRMLYDKPISVRGDHHLKPMERFLSGELGFRVEVSSLFSDDDGELEDRVAGSNSVMVFGSSFEKRVARRLDVPLFRYVYPVFDRIAVYDDAPYAGFRGAVCLTEDIINAMISHEYVKPEERLA